MITTLGDLDRRLRQQELNDKLQRMGSKYLIMSGKGGVGKTTVAASLALAKASVGKKVGLLDIDFHGPNLPGALFLEGEVRADDNGKLVPVTSIPNLSVISIQHLLKNPDESVLWRGPRKIRAILQFLSDTNWGDLDYFFIDSPPGTGDEALTVSKNVPGLKAILVTTAHSLSIADAAKALNYLRSQGVEIFGIVDNMGEIVCPGCGESIQIYPPDTVESFASKEGVPYLGSLPLDIGAQKLSENQKVPIFEAVPDSPFADKIRALAAKL